MSSKQLKTNHLQVLVDDDMLRDLNRLITIQAMELGKRPKSQSNFVRDLIQNEINKKEIELKFFKKKDHLKARS